MTEPKNILLIEVPGIPVAKKRPRFARRGKHVVTYSTQKREERTWRLLAGNQLPRIPLDGPVSVEVRFYLPYPRVDYGTGRNADKLKIRAIDKPHTVKPDLDNLIKFAMDCLNGEAWVDDKQVVLLWATKLYTDGDPRTLVAITHNPEG
jgi:Holliday junction resolvase RusA-like endonuclease